MAFKSNGSGVVMTIITRLSIVLTALVLAEGCSTLSHLTDGFGNEDAHRAAREAPSLRIPPDLSRARVIESMRIPGNEPAQLPASTADAGRAVADGAVRSGLNARLLVDADGSSAIVLAQGFDPVWTAVGAALRSMAVRVDGSDSENGFYDVVYTTTAPERAASFFDTLAFWRDENDRQTASADSNHRLLVRTVERQTVVTVLTPGGEPDRSAAAQQLLAGIEARLQLI